MDESPAFRLLTLGDDGFLGIGIGLDDFLPQGLGGIRVIRFFEQRRL